jgi:adenine-specific DNA methylase
MELNKAIEVLKDRMGTNEIILNDKTYESDFDRFVRIENEAIETVLKYIEAPNKDYDYKGKDRRTTKQIEEQYLIAFKEFLDNNKYAVIDLIVRNGFDITHVVYNHLPTKEYELTYQQIIDRIDNTEWKFLSGGIHLKDKNGKSYFHLQREGKKNTSNRYNVLFHIHLNLFV